MLLVLLALARPICVVILSHYCGACVVGEIVYTIVRLAIGDR